VAEPAYASITLHNVGNAPADLDVRGAWLRFGRKTCKFERRVKLDSYSHRPTADLLPDKISIGAGETINFEVKTRCAAEPGALTAQEPSTDTAELHIEGLAKDVRVKLSNDTPSRT
jgi:hypothetical protein